MDKICRVMMNLIGSEICENAVCADEIKALSDDELKALYKLSKSHDLAHIVGNALLNADLLGEGKLKETYQNDVFTAVYRYETLAYELEELRRVFNEAKIPFIPLKGSVIRKYYPEPWMRTSCDIDILVHEENLERAKKAIIEKLSYSLSNDRTNHDISLYSSNGVHLELHYNLVEDGRFPQADTLLDCCWEYTYSEDSGKVIKFKEPFFYFYHVLHMAKHFKIGGCGVRSFLDLWILNHKVSFDKQERFELLKKSGLIKFVEQSKDLAETWFSGREYTELTRKMETYILQGGVYGTLENRVAVERTKKSKFGYVLSRIWLPYKSLKCLYPSLEKHKWLLPFYEIRRWFALLFNGGVKRGSNELKVNANLSEEKKQAAKNLIDELGL